MSGCQEKQATTVNIVLPDGYLGFFEITEDRANGVDVPLVDGVRTYHVPQSGSLVVNDLRPFSRWHETQAAYESGAQLNINRDARPSASGIMLTTLAASDDRRITFLVGSAEDVRRAFEGEAEVVIGDRSNAD